MNLLILNSYIPIIDLHTTKNKLTKKSTLVRIQSHGKTYRHLIKMDNLIIETTLNPIFKIKTTIQIKGFKSTLHFRLKVRHVCGRDIEAKIHLILLP